MNVTLSAFGGLLMGVTNATAADVVDAEWAVDFDAFGDRLTVELSAIINIAANPGNAALCLRSSLTQGDAAGAILAQITPPAGGTGGETKLFALVSVANPGGQRYVTLTSRGGTGPVSIAYRGALAPIEGPDGDYCNVATTPLIRLRNGAKELADKVDDPSVTDDTWDVWVNQGVEALWALVATAFSDQFFKTFNFSLVGGVGGNSLDVTTITDGDFRRVRFVEVNPDTGARRRVRGFNFNEKNAGVGALNAALWCPLRRYRLMGQKLIVEPYEQAAGAYRLYYVPKPTFLALRCDALDPALDPWAEFPMVFAAMKALGKEESDTGPLGVRLGELKAEIEVAAATRDDGEADVIADVEGTDGGTWGGR